MKLTYKTPDGRVQFEGEMKTALDGFAAVAKLDLLFNTEKVCGCCKSADIGPLVRYPKGFTYYDIECHDCGARIQVHLNKDGGGLYFARHEYPDTNGWGKWESGQDGDGQRQQTTHPQQRVHQPSQGGQGRPQQQPTKQDDDGSIPF